MASGDTLLLLDVAAASISATTDAKFDQVNQQLVLDFDAASTESARFRAKMPRHYSAAVGVDVILHVTMTSATTGTVDWSAAFERQTGENLTTSGFAASQSTNGTTVPGTNGVEFRVTIPFTAGAQMDAVVAGDLFRLLVQRTPVGGGGGAAGDAELRFIELRER